MTRLLLHIGCGPKRKDHNLLAFQSDEWQQVRFDIDESVAPDITGTMTDMSAMLKSYRATIEVLWDRLVHGGLIVLDDCGWASYGAQKSAEDVFMAERGHRVMELPTGQGLLLKH